MKKFILLLPLLLFLDSCKENSNPIEYNYNNVGMPALVMVVENSDNADRQLESIAFTSYRYETLDIFSEIFSVPYDSLLNKDLNQILDQYGEPWQINEITKAATPYYQKIVTLTDQTANVNNLIDSLKILSNNGYTIDLLFSLHGSDRTISFEAGRFSIDDFTNELSKKNIHIRILYQTNCNGATSLNDWSNIGLEACNGTIGNNYLTIFAPINFIKSWVSGTNYKESVDYAYDMEIETLKSFNDKLPLLDYITSGSYLDGSLQIFNGNNIYITKDNYPLLQ